MYTFDNHTILDYPETINVIIKCDIYVYMYIDVQKSIMFIFISDPSFN